MEKRLFLLLIILGLLFSSFIVSAQETINTNQNIAELEQIIKDNNNLLIQNFNRMLEQKLSIYKTPEETLKKIVYDSMKEERIKISIAVFSGVFLALILYSFIRFLFRKREKEVLSMEK